MLERILVAVTSWMNRHEWTWFVLAFALTALAMSLCYRWDFW